ncbi:Rhomboid-related protein 3 [Merluccius polli]|uniref:rhomboid protease n=1 Tax=Merluccius polli TaxID=89951 RepID=A0AA47MG25_MERPO|nr:Rhomboid-related protein 3 [Merluccius polli]
MTTRVMAGLSSCPKVRDSLCLAFHQSPVPHPVSPGSSYRALPLPRPLLARPGIAYSRTQSAEVAVFRQEETNITDKNNTPPPSKNTLKTNMGGACGCWSPVKACFIAACGILNGSASPQCKWEGLGEKVAVLCLCLRPDPPVPPGSPTWILHQPLCARRMRTSNLTTGEGLKCLDSDPNCSGVKDYTAPIDSQHKVFVPPLVRPFDWMTQRERSKDISNDSFAVAIFFSEKENITISSVGHLAGKVNSHQREEGRVASPLLGNTAEDNRSHMFPACSFSTQHSLQACLDSLPAKNNHMYDPESSGFISTERFRDLLATHGSELDPHKLEVLLALADNNAEGKICYQDFVNLMSNKRSNSFRRAILQGGRQLKGSALREEVGLGLSQRLVRHVAYETLPREVDRKWYFDSYTYCPPPWLILLITVAEVVVFMYYGFQLDRWVLQVSSPSYLKGPLPYHPQLRSQAWRYLSYAFMHTGIEHLSLNMAMQLLVGVPLEMVHGALRITLIYVCGVLAGSLAVSVTDMTAPVVGSSGGVYALVSAHLANVVMNWSGMKCQFKLFRMAMALVCMSVEFGRAVWLRFYPPAFPPCPNPSFVAHLGGVAVGLTVGVVILQNYEQRLQEQSLFWIFFCVYALFVLCAVFWNVFAYSLLDVRLPPPP